MLHEKLGGEVVNRSYRCPGGSVHAAACNARGGHCHRGQYPAGEDAMDRAERMLAIPEHAANDPSTNAGETLEQLRAQLDQMMKVDG